MSGHATGLVLAGGASRRMGGIDKRAVRVGGRPLLLAAVEAVRDVCEEVLIAVGDDPPPVALRNVRVVGDLRPGCGPLAGLEAGLAAASHPVIVVVAGDHPAAAPAVLADLRDRLAGDTGLDAVVLGTDHGPQPLVGAYRGSCLGAVSGLLDAGERRARAVLDVLRTEVVATGEWRHLDPQLATAVDLDTPEDLEAWRRRGDGDGDPRDRDPGAVPTDEPPPSGPPEPDLDAERARP